MIVKSLPCVLYFLVYETVFGMYNTSSVLQNHLHSIWPGSEKKFTIHNDHVMVLFIHHKVCRAHNLKYYSVYKHRKYCWCCRLPTQLIQNNQMRKFPACRVSLRMWVQSGIRKKEGGQPYLASFTQKVMVLILEGVQWNQSQTGHGE